MQRRDPPSPWVHTVALAAAAARSRTPSAPHRHTPTSPNTAEPGQDVHQALAGPGGPGAMLMVELALPSMGGPHGGVLGSGSPWCLGSTVGRACWSLLFSPGDDSSGSGSGDSCPDDLCDRRVSKKSSSSRTTLTHALPGLSEREGQKTSAASCPQPCASLLLLPLLLSAARPTWR